MAINLLHETNAPDMPPPPKKQGMGPLSTPPPPPPPPMPSTPPIPPIQKKTSMRMNSSANPASSGERILKQKKSAPTQAPVFADVGLDVNLLSDELTTKFDKRGQLLKLGFVALGAVVLVGIVYGALYFLQGSVTKQVDADRSQLQTVQTQISALNATQKDITTTTGRLQAIKALIDQHVHWTNFFDRLEHYTLPGVTYGTSFSGGSDGNFTLTAKADSFDTVAAQYLAYQQAVKNGDFLKSFAITGATKQTTKDGTTVSFSVTLSVLPSVFTPATKAAASTNTNTTTTP